MRTRFDEQLDLLHRQLILMGAVCEQAIARSVKALSSGDNELAQSVAEMADQVKEKEREIESLCLKLLLQQQPVATDLRVISSALKMVTDLERIGDNSWDIAEIILKTNLTGVDESEEVHDMALEVIQMVTDSIDAFVKSDITLARGVIKNDDTVDCYFNHIKKVLLQRLRNPETEAEYALDLMMVVKYLERIGDHAVNVARWVLFSLTGVREGNS